MRTRRQREEEYDDGEEEEEEEGDYDDNEDKDEDYDDNEDEDDDYDDNEGVDGLVSSSEDSVESVETRRRGKRKQMVRQRPSRSSKARVARQLRYESESEEDELEMKRPIRETRQTRQSVAGKRKAKQSPQQSESGSESESDKDELEMKRPKKLVKRSGIGTRRVATTSELRREEEDSDDEVMQKPESKLKRRKAKGSEEDLLSEEEQLLSESEEEEEEEEENDLEWELASCDEDGSAKDGIQTRREFMRKRRFLVRRKVYKKKEGHNCSVVDCVTMEKLDTDHVVWRNAQSRATYCYNLSTIWKVAAQKGRWSEPPTFLEPMQKATAMQIEDKFFFDPRSVDPKTRNFDSHQGMVEILPEDQGLQPFRASDYLSMLDRSFLDQSSLAKSKDLYVCPICFEMSMSELADKQDTRPDPLDVIALHHDYQGGILMCFEKLGEVQSHLQAAHQVRARKRAFHPILQNYKVRGTDGLVQQYVSEYTTLHAQEKFGPRSNGAWAHDYWKGFPIRATVFNHLLSGVMDLRGKERLFTTFPVRANKRDSKSIWHDILKSFGEAGSASENEFLTSDEDQPANVLDNAEARRIDLEEDAEDMKDARKLAESYETRQAQGMGYSSEENLSDFVAESGDEVDDEKSHDEEEDSWMATPVKGKMKKKVTSSASRSPGKKRLVKATPPKKVGKFSSEWWSKVKRAKEESSSSSSSSDEDQVDSTHAQTNYQTPRKRKLLDDDSDDVSDDDVVEVPPPKRPARVIIEL